MKYTCMKYTGYFCSIFIILLSVEISYAITRNFLEYKWPCPFTACRKQSSRRNVATKL